MRTLPEAAHAGRPGPRLLHGVERLRHPLRITAILLVVGPVLDLILATLPALPADPGWRLGVAAGLPSALLVPFVAAALLAVLAAARPSRVSTGLALGAVLFCGLLAGFAVATLVNDVVATARLGGAPTPWMLWPPLLGFWEVAAAAGLAWGLLHPPSWSLRGDGPPGLHRLGIDLLD